MFHTQSIIEKISKLLPESFTKKLPTAEIPKTDFCLLLVLLKCGPGYEKTIQVTPSRQIDLQ